MEIEKVSTDAKNDAKNLEEKLIDLINENNGITKIIMAERTGVSKATVERCIKASNRIFMLVRKKADIGKLSK